MDKVTSLPGSLPNSQPETIRMDATGPSTRDLVLSGMSTATHQKMLVAGSKMDLESTAGEPGTLVVQRTDREAWAAILSELGNPLEPNFDSMVDQLSRVQRMFKRGIARSTLDRMGPVAQDVRVEVHAALSDRIPQQWREQADTLLFSVTASGALNQDDALSDIFASIQHVLASLPILEADLRDCGDHRVVGLTSQSTKDVLAAADFGVVGLEWAVATASEEEVTRKRVTLSELVVAAPRGTALRFTSKGAIPTAKAGQKWQGPTGFVNVHQASPSHAVVEVTTGNYSNTVLLSQLDFLAMAGKYGLTIPGSQHQVVGFNISQRARFRAARLRQRIQTIIRNIQDGVSTPEQEKFLEEYQDHHGDGMEPWSNMPGEAITPPNQMTKDKLVSPAREIAPLNMITPPGATPVEIDDLLGVTDAEVHQAVAEVMDIW